MKTNSFSPSISAIRRKAWAAAPGSVQEFAHQLMSFDPKQCVEIELEDFYTLRKKSEIDANGIAHIQIKGMLLDDAPKICEKLGFCTLYSTIIEEIEEFKEDGAKGILFEVNSPGGTVSGSIEAANAIANAGMKTAAFCIGMACSAAYKLVSQTGFIMASPSADVGNIGTIMVWADDDAFWASMGIVWKAMTNEGADLKSTFHLEPNDTQLAFLQDSLNQSGEEFRKSVTIGRALAGATLNDEVWRAGWYSGAIAESLGLIDYIGTLDEAAEGLAEMVG